MAEVSRAGWGGVDMHGFCMVERINLHIQSSEI